MNSRESVANEVRRRLGADPNFLHDKDDPESENYKDARMLFDRCVDACRNNGRDWGEIRAVLKSLKLHNEWKSHIERLAKSSLRVVASTNESRTKTTIRDFWEDAPVHSEATMPTGWFIDEIDNKIYRLVERTVNGDRVMDSTEVSGHPLVVQKRIQQDETGEIYLEIGWKAATRWKSSVYLRDACFDTKQIVKSARVGISVGSDNAMEIVKFLRAYESHNLLRIARGFATGRQGWQGEPDDPTHHGFVSGYGQIGGNGKSIEMRPFSDGDRVVADQLHDHGSFEEWKDAIGKVSKWPAIKLAIYGSLAPPLLAILRCQNVIIEWVGRSSRGKTTALQIGQSCWRSAETKIPNWNATVNGFESMAKFLSDMPLFIDDTKQAIEHGKGAQIAKIIYQFVSGSGRTRSDRDVGQRVMSTWRSVMLSTGEVRATDIAKDEGAATRVLSLWGNPCGELVLPAIAAEIADVVSNRLTDNYGHAGPRVVAWLCKHRSRWPELRALFNETADKVRKSYESAAASRLAKVVALLEVASFVASEAGCLPWKYIPLLEDVNVKEMIGASLEQASLSADRAREAWSFVNSYAEARPDAWVDWGCNANVEKQPSTGWLGWRNELVRAWLPSQLKRALRDGQYDESVFQAWKDARIIQCAERSRFESRCRCGGPDPDNKEMKSRHRVILVRQEDATADEVHEFLYDDDRSLPSDQTRQEPEQIPIEDAHTDGASEEDPWS